MPATSPLDKLISITAISVLSCFKTIRDWFRSFGFCIGGLHRVTSATMCAISSPPPHSIFFRALDALTVDDGGARAGFSVGQLTTLYIERVMNAIERAVPSPQVKIVVHRAPCCAVVNPSGSLAIGNRCSAHTSGH